MWFHILGGDIMKIEHPDIYFGKKIRVYCYDGQVFTGELEGYNFDYDDNGEQFAEIDLDTPPYGIEFTEMEIERIEVIGDAERQVR